MPTPKTFSSRHVSLAADGSPVITQDGGGSDATGTDRIQELLGNITNLSDDELVELRDLVLQQIDSGRSDSLSVETLEELAEAATAVRNEVSRRQNNVKRAADARGIVASLRDDFRPGGALVPEDNQPSRWRLGAGSGVGITASGTPLSQAADLGREVLDVAKRMTVNPRPGRTAVARLSIERPASRTLTADDATAITAALDAAGDEHIEFVRSQLADPKALTAAGGLVAPEAVDYTLPGFETADRPVRDALPSFTATRGAVRYVMPPTLSDTTGAIGVWTVQNDIDAVTNAAVRKPSARIDPHYEVVVDIQAVTNILIFGNLVARAFPEHVTRATELALAAHARVAEQQLLTQIGALSTHVSGGAAESSGLGAVRVLLPLYERLAVGIRNRLRMADDAPLQLFLPDWAEGILRSDLALQEPGDTALGVTDEELMSYFAARQIAVTYALDGEAGQQFDVQNPGPVNAWPTSVVGYMFPAGAFQFLDGGELDLGLIRDAELNAANDFQFFSESFEAVLFRGGEAYRIDQAVTASGITRAAA